MSIAHNVHGINVIGIAVSLSVAIHIELGPGVVLFLVLLLELLLLFLLLEGASQVLLLLAKITSDQLIFVNWPISLGN